MLSVLELCLFVGRLIALMGVLQRHVGLKPRPTFVWCGFCRPKDRPTKATTYIFILIRSIGVAILVVVPSGAAFYAV